ncbi:MAG: hypothetical protein ACJ759_25190, partial [Thermoanaerobaculia bacterium]
PPDPGEAVAGQGRPDFPMACQNAFWASVKIFDAPNSLADLRRKIRRAKFFCGALKKFSARQIGPRRAEFFYGASNPAAEHCGPANRAKKAD